MMAVRTRKPVRAVGAAARNGAALCGCGVRVDAEERLHLINACAFFKAQRYRTAEPGRIRGQDLRQAAREIDGALERRTRSRKR